LLHVQAFELRFVYTPQARNFGEVGRFHKYIDEQVGGLVNEVKALSVSKTAF
jgi:hypothetical protein